MTVFDVQQRSPEWYELRRGIPTASEFHRILTATGERSRQREEYLCELIAERLGAVTNGFSNQWTERGVELENIARLAYSIETGYEVTPVGFVLADGGYGASPDGFVGEEGLLEIKCLKPANHIRVLFDAPPEKFSPQIQGQLLVCERAWLDLFFFCPELPPRLIRVDRDEQYIALLAAELKDFLLELETRFSRLWEEWLVT